MGKFSSKIVGNHVFHSSTNFRIRAESWTCPKCSFINGKKNHKCHNKGCNYKYDNLGKVKVSSKRGNEKYVTDSVKNLQAMHKEGKI